ncbi:hypothetical protein BCR44DRAFT_1052733 [Catenaria anguillulae PL171]|uniref:Sugar phosphate transporter domain-containing protein n=1 Tax=Catenaria anguillulae PL171 TaxID=765915 RepID=A0A1Y2HR92_9FUNG|nr:hypothetical protein BCR44DRAFT_1052733 [Catenaria anguillulae PL171]
MVVFGDTLTLQNVLGLVISLAGIIWFNYYRNATAAAASRSRSPSPSPASRRGNMYRMVRTKPIEAEL